MRRKGFLFLGEKTVEMVIAVLCIVVLIYLGVRIYTTSTSTGNLEKAQNNIDKIGLALGEAKKSGFSTVFVLQPTDWVIISWPYKFYGDKPNKCKATYCICICDALNSQVSASSDESFVNKCNANGICFDSNERIDTLNPTTSEPPIPIQNPPILLNIKYDKNIGYIITKQ